MTDSDAQHSAPPAGAAGSGLARPAAGDRRRKLPDWAQDLAEHPAWQAAVANYGLEVDPFEVDGTGDPSAEEPHRLQAPHELNRLAAQGLAGRAVSTLRALGYAVDADLVHPPTVRVLGRA